MSVCISKKDIIKNFNVITQNRMKVNNSNKQKKHFNKENEQTTAPNRIAREMPRKCSHKCICSATLQQLLQGNKGPLTTLIMF